MKIEGKPLVMELSTGAGVSLVSEKAVQMILPSHTTQATRTQLRTYSGGSHSGGSQGGCGSAIPGATDKVACDS